MANLSVVYNKKPRRLRIPEHQASLLPYYLNKIGAVWLNIQDSWYILYNDMHLEDEISTGDKLLWPSEFTSLESVANNIFSLLHVGSNLQLPNDTFYVGAIPPRLFSGVAAISVLEDVKFRQVKVGKILVQGTGLFSITLKKLSYNSIEVRDFRFGPHAPVAYGEFL